MNPARLFARGAVPALAAVLAGSLAAQGVQREDGSPDSPFLEARFLARPPAGPAPLEVHFVDRSLGDVTAWRWDFGDGTTSSAASPRHTYTEGGLYSVRLTVRRRDGRTDTVLHEDGVVVSSCPSDSARDNRATPLELGEDFVPVTGDDAQGFYVVYSGKATGPNNPSPSNNVGLFLFPLAGDEVLLFGSGYGDANVLVEPTGSAAWDVQRIDGLIRFCLGGAPGRTRVRFVAPHGHLDHINADCMRELRRRGYEIPEIAFHAGDAGLVQSLPGWTPQDKAAFRTLRGTTGQCQEELLAYDSPLGKIWFYSRPGHTPGSIDLALDVGGDPTNRFLVRGSAAIFGTCPVTGTREAIDPHGNVHLSALPPRVAAASPAHASALGNTLVALSGSGFAAPGAGLPRVLIDGVDASAVQVLDDATLTCRAPPGTPGALAEVRVLTRSGQDRLAGGLTYRALPTVAAIAPDHGLTGGGARVTVTGSGFQDLDAGPCTVRLGGLAATGVTVLDDRTLTCDAPALPSGLADLEVTNLNGAAVLPQAFRVDPVVEIDEVLPIGGTSLGDSRIVVRGRFFAVGATLPRVFLGTGEALDVTRVSDTRLDCTTPPGTAGTWVDVRVVADNGEAVLASGFRYFSAPGVTEVQPASGAARGGETVTVRGLGFTRNNAGPCSVRFGDTPAVDVVVLSDGALRCTVPAGVPGLAIPVEVANANGSGRAASAYRYHRVPLPVAVEPARGTHLGGTWIDVQAGGLLETGAGVPVVTLGGVPATDTVVLADDLLRCRTPAGTPGGVELVLTNANGEGRLADAFRFVVAPVATAVTPDVGAARGGDTLTLHGAGFLAPGAGPPAVRLGRARASDVTVLDDTRLVLVAPPGPPGRSVDVHVETLNGRTRLADGFHYHALPGLSKVTPPRGPEAGGTPLVLTGQGFLAPGAGPPRVRIGGRAATNVVVLDDGRLTCDAPAGDPGAAAVRLATAWGDAFLPDAFVYGSPAPTLQSVAPSSGSALGGTHVTLTGSGFGTLAAGPNEVRFGTGPATDVVVLDDRTLTCTTPPGAPGSLVDVALTNGNGSAGLPGAWRYSLQPTLAALNPAEGTAAGGVLVQIRGSGFLADAAGANEVLFGQAAATAVTVADDTRLSCRTPAGAPGTVVDVVVRNANGSARLAGAWRHHESPRVLAITPAAGSMAGGTPVVVEGAGFVSGTDLAVRLGGLLATGVVVQDDATLTCLTPAFPAPGPVAVTITTSDGQGGLADAFRVFAPPALGGLSPADGPASGDTAVLLTGSGFLVDVAGPNQVTFGGVPAVQVNTLDDTRVRAWAPPGTPGERVVVTLTNANGSSSRDGFRYHARPGVDALAPTSGTPLGGALVTVRGAGFLVDGAGPNEVRFGTAAATEVTVVDDATLTCRAPVGAPASLVTVQVVNANGTSDAGPSFRYHAAPTLSAVGPFHGYSGGTTPVELTGTGFLLDGAGTPEVRFGTTPAAGVTVLDDTRLACLAPAGVSGPVTVRVRTANGLADLVDGFTYDWAPTLLALAPAAGPAGGGTLVDLDGAGFDTPGSGPPAVRFGTRAATGVQVLSGTHLRCRVPAGTGGQRTAVTVTNAHGSSTLGDAWSYHPLPRVTAVTPDRGPAAGGTAVTVHGSGFAANGAGVPLVTLGGSAASAVIVVDDATLTCSVPAGPERTLGELRVANACGVAVLADAFRWTAPAHGDLDEDGLADLVVGGRGSVFVAFSGTPIGFRTSSQCELTLLASATSEFGETLAIADLDDDGFQDLVVGAPGDGTAGSAGAVYVYRGPLGPAALSLTTSDADVVLVGEASQDAFGAALAVGDLDGDQRDDLVVGAPGNNAAGTDAGAVYVFRGQPSFASRPADLADARFLGARAPDGFGAAVACADVNGDGRDDLVAGAPAHRGSGSSSGAAYLFLGETPLAGRSALLASAAIEGAQSGDRLGTAVAAGDLDGDGLAELVLGAPEADRGGSGSGSVFVVRGAPSVPSGSADLAAAILDGENGGDRMGRALATGDLDGDGRVDLLIGAPSFDSPTGNCGRAYALLGGPLAGGPIALRADTVLVSEGLQGDEFGASLAALDLDGDDRAEALIAAPLGDDGAADTGRVHVFEGANLAPARSASAPDATVRGVTAGQELGHGLGRR